MSIPIYYSTCFVQFKPDTELWYHVEADGTIVAVSVARLKSGNPKAVNLCTPQGKWEWLPWTSFVCGLSTYYRASCAFGHFDYLLETEPKCLFSKRLNRAGVPIDRSIIRLGKHIRKPLVLVRLEF
jgi:hypothetical protein